MPQRKNNTLGELGERYACHVLQEKGYIILDRNFRTRFGEIDIVAKHVDVLVFVEVKTRRNTKHGLPEEAVSDTKLNKIRETAYLYIKKHTTTTKKQRIEVVSILVNSDNTIDRIRHITVG